MSKFEAGDLVRIQTDEVFEICYVNSEDGRIDMVPVSDPHDMSIEFVRPEYLELVEREFNLGDVVRVRANDEVLVVVRVDTNSVSVYSTLDKSTYVTDSSDLNNSKYYKIVRS